MRQGFENIEGTADILLAVLKTILEEPAGMTICDLGCCEASVTHRLPVGQKVYVDLVKRDIKGFEPHKDIFVQDDVLHYLQTTEKRFSAAIALDLIEHLTEENGRLLINLMQLRADRVIIFTPLGDYLLEETPTDNPDAHRSGWLPETFEELGMATIVFHNFHPSIKAGGLFAFYSKDIKNESARVFNILETQKLPEWIKSQELRKQSETV